MTLIIAHFHQKFANNDSSGDLEDTFIFFAFSSGKKVKLYKIWQYCKVLHGMHLSKIFIKPTYEHRKNFSVDKLYKIYDYMHLLFDAWRFARIYVVSSPYFAINKNINFFRGSIYRIHLWHVFEIEQHSIKYKLNITNWFECRNLARFISFSIRLY